MYIFGGTQKGCFFHWVRIWPAPWFTNITCITNKRSSVLLVWWWLLPAMKGPGLASFVDWKQEKDTPHVILHSRPSRCWRLPCPSRIFIGSFFMCFSESFLTLQPMDCNPPGSSVHGIFQARILEWTAISYSKGSFQPRDQICVSCISCIGRQMGSLTCRFLDLSGHMPALNNGGLWQLQHS